MNRKIKFIILSVLLFAGRFYDIYTTSLYTPNLDKELNPLVKFLGAGWTAMIIIQVLLTLFVVVCLYYYMFHFHPALPKEMGLNRKQVISFMMYNETNSIRKMWHSLPHNKSVLFSSTGYVATGVLIIISYVVGTSTTYLIHSAIYRDWYAKGIPYIFYIVIIVTAIILYYRFFNHYYQKYLVFENIQH